MVDTRACLAGTDARDLCRSSNRREANVEPSNGSKGSRRRFFGQAAALGGAGALAPLKAHAGDALVPPWMQAQGRPVLSPAYGQPSPHEADVVRRQFVGTPTTTAAASLTPVQDLHGIVTPNGLVFERHHAGIPDIAPERHRLLLHGLVKRPLVFGMDELMRFPSVSRLHFLECSGNTLTEWSKPAQTAQHTHGLISCCEWTGVPLSTLLDEAGVEPDAAWVLAEGADAAAMTRSVPLAKALDDALVVYAQNGEMLRPEQGYPLRLLLPGYEGNMSVKWLRRLKLGREPFMTREETAKYTDLMPDGQARQFTFVMEAKSVIVRPSGGQRLQARGFYEIFGLAWSGRGRIRRVEVSTDGGASWQDARLQEPVLSKCLTAFRLPWRWDGAPAVLQSRAVDETGYVQPRRDALLALRGGHSFYHYNGIQSWKVAADGGVENVHA
jgi:sulfane dehydrogenase subunit SoxC